MNVLITGAGGFIGSYLARLAASAGHSVLGIDVKEPDVEACSFNFERCDMRDTGRVFNTIASFQPERIFHLAAQSYPTVSMIHPLDTMEINAGGTINIFEGVRAAGIKPVVVVACSSAEYGVVAAEDLPVKEDHSLRPLHPYGVSKVAQDLLASQYFANYGIPTVRIRIFNTTGPGKRDDVCSDFTRRAVEIELGIRRSLMTVGNLTTRRAIIDVRDMVRGLWLSAERGEYGEVYNVGSNNIYSGQELVDAIRSHIKMPLALKQDPALLRTCDEPVIAGDTTKFRRCSSWKPEIGLDQTISDMIDWWRNHLAPAAESNKSEVGIPQEEVSACE
jgi:GDP-4-dehydro-6-deoxy-D-mannose reductase